MRAAILASAIAAVLAAAGCPGGDDGGCTVDDDCAGSLVCARNGECLPGGEVRAARVTWTIRGAAASATTCAGTPDFYLLFAGIQVADTFGFAPVPCDAGLFFIDKLPRRYVSVEIGVESGSLQEAKQLDAQGNAAFDLAP